jgi:predicted cupin superfamily sugar epimerase
VRIPAPAESPAAYDAGFEFSGFEFGDRERLLAEVPQAAPWIERLMAD